MDLWSLFEPFELLPASKPSESCAFFNNPNSDLEDQPVALPLGSLRQARNTCHRSRNALWTISKTLTSTKHKDSTSTCSTKWHQQLREGSAAHHLHPHISSEYIKCDSRSQSRQAWRSFSRNQPLLPAPFWHHRSQRHLRISPTMASTCSVP